MKQSMPILAIIRPEIVSTTRATGHQLSPATVMGPV
jgi:hypothetical protein